LKNVNIVYKLQRILQIILRNNNSIHLDHETFLKLLGQIKPNQTGMVYGWFLSFLNPAMEVAEGGTYVLLFSVNKVKLL
jgi:hypothetical protein